MRRYQQRLFALPAAADVFLKLGAELGDRIFYRPGRAIRQAANRRPWDDADRIGDFQQDVQVFPSPSAPANPIQDFQHPARSLAAGSALPALLMCEELAGIVKYIDNAGSCVEDDDRSGP